MSSAGMGILLGSNVVKKEPPEILYVPKKEGPFELNENHELYLEHWPVEP